jgi:hypothetical protein
MTNTEANPSTALEHRDHEAGPLALLFDAHTEVDALVAAAMRACDARGDGSAARQEMRLACVVTPPLLRGDLLHHFTATYGAVK